MPYFTDSFASARLDTVVSQNSEVSTENSARMLLESLQGKGDVTECGMY